MLDVIDYKLCELLQTRGRASQLELAQAVKLSQPAVAERIRKLEEQGVITSYVAHVDAKALGKDSVGAADLRHTTLVENYLSGIVGKTAAKRPAGAARAMRGSAV